MRVPKTIDVYGVRYTTRYYWRLTTEEGEHVDGACDTKKKEIQIDRMVPKDERDVTYLHELLHAIIHELKINNTSLHQDVEEIIVEGISDFLLKKFNMRLKNGKRR